MNQTSKYIIIQLPNKDQTEFKMRAASTLETLKQNGIDISNVLILPEDVHISCIDLPIINGKMTLNE